MRKYMTTSSTRLFKDRTYEQLARIGKAVASPQRLELLELVSQAPRTVERLAQDTQQTIANTSRHLQILRAARLVDTQKVGTFVHYRIAGETVAGFLRELRLLAANQFAELDRISRQFFAEGAVLEAVDRKALLTRVRKGEVTLLDVRPIDEYAAGHIAGAMSMPLSELKHRLAEVPKHQEVVAYCRGPYCVLAAQAVEFLQKHGFRAARLEDSVTDWRAHKLPVTVGPHA
jgi:rhodanese-related sulfurtransferase/DNA-binding transcriptional ArsR family regulator